MPGVNSSALSGAKTVGAILGTEGGHPLEGQIANLQTLYDAGFRLMGLTHFFDNELGGSLHGESGAGLSDFGRQVVDGLMARGMECVDHGTVSTETKDCTWAEPGSALAKFTGPELSDHNACWADCRFAK